jgi:hypothetical protein
MALSLIADHVMELGVTRLGVIIAAVPNVGDFALVILGRGLASPGKIQ